VSSCTGEDVVLTATGGTAYNWSTGENTSSIVVHPATDQTYVVTVSENGCSSTASVNVAIHPVPVVDLGNNDTLCGWSYLVLDAGSGYSSYTWSTGAHGQVILADTTGHGLGDISFSVQVTSSYGCAGSDTIVLTFIDCNSGITENAGGRHINIYPNPAGDLLYLSAEGFGDETITLELLDITGKLLLSQSLTFESGSALRTLDLSAIPTGVYVLKTTGATWLHEYRIVKE
jgi:hypothetical protein